jgi:hypothetical protein
MARRTQVDDSQPPMAEPQTAVDVMTLTIRTTMADDVRHRLQDDR